MSEEAVPVEVVRSFRSLAVRYLGLDIPRAWEPLVGARIAKRLQHLKLPLRKYLCRLYQQRGAEEIVSFWQLVRPRPAQFFDRWPDYLRLHSHVERKLAQGERLFRFWSAGCGSGEEAYAMAIITQQIAEWHGIPPEHLDLKILVTDLSSEAFAAGRRGVYERSQLEQVPAALRRRYFSPGGGGVGIAEAMRTHLRFRCLNLARLDLARSPFPMTRPFDAIFCHEGLAPLVPDARARIIPTLQQLLGQDGIFCAGFAREAQSSPGDLTKGGAQACVAVAPRAPGDC
jgi:chemotaxis protein methyltransferase CheR